MEETNQNIDFSSPIVPFSQQDFFEAWEQIKKDLKVDIGPPHDLRHSGAARDVSLGRRSLEEVRRRGRWKSTDSAARYTKTFLLVRARSKISAGIMQEDAKLAKQRGPVT